mmetsp:Transcript_61726/g.143614  ORF Transcript_61726/g.143614 Transcript_61726/m.143614 type:complete len:260 (+) Transcript_61726:1646-2425(+)
MHHCGHVEHGHQPRTAASGKVRGHQSRKLYCVESPTEPSAGQLPPSTLLVDLRKELGQVVAKTHCIASAAPALPDDAADNACELLCLGLGALKAHVLQRPQLPSLQEEPGHTQGPLIARHFIGKHQGLNEGTQAIALEALRKQAAKPRGDLLERAAVGVAVVHDLHELDGTALHDLVQDQLRVEVIRSLLLIGLEAPDVVQAASAERLEQALQVGNVPLGNGSGGGLAKVGLAQGAHQWASRFADQPLTLREQAVIVFV